MYLKTIKIGEYICTAILILKMEENTHFQHTMLYYFKKDKNTTVMQKRFVQCMEKVL